VVQLPQIEGTQGAVAGILDQFNQGEHYTPASSAAQAVKQQAHAHDADTGLAMLRVLSMASAGGAALNKHAHNAKASADLIGSEAMVRFTTTDQVVPGSVLITHPVACLGQPTLHHAVILIVAVGESVQGVIINKPLGVSLSQAVNASAELPDGLAACELTLGGDVSREIWALHTQGQAEVGSDVERGEWGLEGSVRVADNLWITRQLGKLTDANPGTTRCVMGHCGWARDQLDSELERKVWFLAQPEAGSSIAKYALANWVQPTEEQFEHTWMRDTMWAGAMHQLGGEYEALAKFPGSHDVLWELMEEVWKDQVTQLNQRIRDSD